MINSSIGSSHVHSRGWRVCPPRDGKVDSNPPPVDLHARTALPCLLRVIHMLEVDESKTTTPSRCAVVNDVRVGQRSITTKDFLQIFLARIVGEIEDSETRAFGRSFPVSFVAFPVRHRRPRATIAITTGRTAVVAPAIPRARPRARIAASAIARSRSRPRAAPTSIATSAPATPVSTPIPTFASRCRTLAFAATDAATLAPGCALLLGGRSFPTRALSGGVRVYGSRRWAGLATRHRRG